MRKDDIKHISTPLRSKNSNYKNKAALNGLPITNQSKAEKRGQNANKYI